MKRLSTILLLVLVALMVFSIPMSAASPYQTYTYSIDGVARYSPDAYVPLQDLFTAALEKQPTPQYYSADGVHPNENGAKFIAEHYVNAINKIFN